MKPILQYVLTVDTYRRPSRRRNTYGRYRVGAKTAKEAVALLRNKIGFGSIRVIGTADRVDSREWKLHDVAYKEVRQYVFDERYQPSFKDAIHATAPHSKQL